MCSKPRTKGLQIECVCVCVCNNERINQYFPGSQSLCLILGSGACAGSGRGGHLLRCSSTSTDAISSLGCLTAPWWKTTITAFPAAFCSPCLPCLSSGALGFSFVSSTRSWIGWGQGVSLSRSAIVAFPRAHNRAWPTVVGQRVFVEWIDDWIHAWAQKGPSYIQTHWGHLTANFVHCAWGGSWWDVMRPLGRIV